MRNGETHSRLRRSLLAGGSAEEWRQHLRRSEALQQEVAEIAHDLNNLLLVIGTAATATRLGLDRDARLSRYLSNIDDAVGEGAALTRRLLRLARPAEPRGAPLDLVAGTRRAAELARWLLPAGISLQLELPDESAPAGIDRTAFLRVVQNLVANCADALGERGRVILRVRRSDDRGGVVLEVADDGPGMTDEVRRRAQEPYFTTRGEGGTGLGLAVVQGIAREHGGDVEIDSEPGRGTTVRVRLPAAEAATGEEQDPGAGDRG